MLCAFRKFCLLALLYILNCRGARGQFPRRCTDQASLKSRRCCPTGDDGSECSETSQKGACSLIDPDLSNAILNETLDFLLDDRAWWPRAFYDHACVCNGNHDGIDCSECKFGYEGEDCTTKSALRIRKNINSLSNEEKEQYVSIIHESKRRTSENYVILTTSFDKILQENDAVFKNISLYDLFVWMHYYATRDNLLVPNTTMEYQLLKNNNTVTGEEARSQIARDLLSDSPTLDQISPNVDYAHEGSTFPPWHRYFMLKWEKEIGEYVANDTSFSLPYWDWRNQTSCNVCNDFLFGESREEGLLSDRCPFSEWDVICTQFNEYLKRGLQCDGTAETNITRNPGQQNTRQTSGLPTSEEIDKMFAMDVDFDTPPYNKISNMSFRNMIEGFADPNNGIYDGRSYVHNSVHVWLNGTMSSVDTAANDPIFLSHHSFVDSLFEIWLRKNRDRDNDGFFQDPDGPNVGHRLKDYMVPFFPLVQNKDGFAETADLGYVYDYLPKENSATNTKFSVLPSLVTTILCAYLLI